MVVNSRICDCIRDDITKFTGGMLLVDLQIRSLIVRGATKLLSLLWYKPGVRLPPRVANVVQTGGETLAGKWVDVSVSIRLKYRCQSWYKPGGK